MPNNQAIIWPDISRKYLSIKYFFRAPYFNDILAKIHDKIDHPE